MRSAVATLNRVLHTLADTVLSPLDRLSPLVGLAVVSLLTASLMLLVVRVTSDQKRLAEVTRAMQARLFEIRLFNDDLGAIWRAEAAMLRQTLTYLRLWAVPLLWLVLPLVLMMAQLQAHYGYTGLDVGRPALVTVRLKPGWEREARSLTLHAPAGVRVETPMVWIPVAREAAWRIVADRPGEYELSIRLETGRFTKSLRVSEQPGRRSPIRPSGLLDQALHVAELPLPAEAGISAIGVSYPARAVQIFGWEAHWLVVFMAFSFVAALLLKTRFKVAL